MIKSIFQEKQLINYEFIECHQKTKITTVLLGGVLQDMASWKNYVKEFSQFNNVLVVDLPGVGISKVLNYSFGFDFLADCLFQVIQVSNIEKVNIFSTSYSTVIAFEFSKKYSRLVDKLVLSSTMTEIPFEQRSIMISCLREIEKKNLVSFAETFLEGISNLSVKPKNHELTKRVIKSGIKSLTQLQINQFIQNTKRILNYQTDTLAHVKIGITPLIFTGELATFTPPHLCEKIGRYYQNYTFKPIPGLDHFFHIVNNQLIFSSMIPYFLEGDFPGFDSENDANRGLCGSLIWGWRCLTKMVS